MFLDSLQIKWIDHSRGLWTLVTPLGYETEEETRKIIIVVPAGFETDGASVPFDLVLTPFGGLYPRAAVLHDYLYILLHDKTPHPFYPTRKDADNLFLEAMVSEGVSWYVRNVMYVAVRLFGGDGLLKDLVVTKSLKKYIAGRFVENRV